MEKRWLQQPGQERIIICIYNFLGFKLFACDVYLHVMYYLYEVNDQLIREIAIERNSSAVVETAPNSPNIANMIEQRESRNKIYRRRNIMIRHRYIRTKMTP